MRDGDIALFDPYFDLVVGVGVIFILDTDGKLPVGGALVGVELDGPGAEGGGPISSTKRW